MEFQISVTGSDVLQGQMLERIGTQLGKQAIQIHVQVLTVGGDSRQFGAVHGNQPGEEAAVSPEHVQHDGLGGVAQGANVLPIGKAQPVGVGAERTFLHGKHHHGANGTRLSGVDIRIQKDHVIGKGNLNVRQEGRFPDPPGGNSPEEDGFYPFFAADNPSSALWIYRS